MKNIDVDKSALTIIAVWDSFLPEDSLFFLDVYNPIPSVKEDMIIVENASPNRNHTPPIDWYEAEAPHISKNMLYPERIRCSEYGETVTKPIHVIEVYGMGGVAFPHKTIEDLVGAGIMIVNDLPEGKVKWVEGEAVPENTTLKNLEVTREQIQRTLDAVLRDKLPSELTNVVVRDYEKVGEYAHLQ